MNSQRNTVQRQIILEAVKKFHTHPKVEEIYSEIHKNHPTISKATVYRNLRQLAENGDICQVSLLDDLDRFDGRISRHYHFKCKICGCISDVDVEYLADINETVRQKYGFQVSGHDVIFKGICLECEKSANKGGNKISESQPEEAGNEICE